MYLNTRGENTQKISAELHQFLRYVEESTDDVAAGFGSPRLKQLHNRVKSIKSNEGIEVKYMQLWEEKLMERQEGRQEGRKEGQLEGESRFALLTEKLLKDSRTEDLLRATNDKVFREMLYKEYCVDNSYL